MPIGVATPRRLTTGIKTAKLLRSPHLKLSVATIIIALSGWFSRTSLPGFEQVCTKAAFRDAGTAA
ncbi:hypothetical protein H8B02_06900 [Bradyrhizobium sp. Pear77]|uniref:hypothetical protein n=1 Tax=Bradyrhizobium altum TaxID=1571202 RepID=UPI001E4E6D28|nr:hypothetical protein [Bradyrhizobium altum]MCC8953206.1 hypothetical protein [Bradyrhizobium altum]